jgi:hypothetical protein
MFTVISSLFGAFLSYFKTHRELVLETIIPIRGVSMVGVWDTTSWHYNTFSENQRDQNASV